MAKLVAKQPIDTTALPGLSPLYSPSIASFNNREPDGFTATLDDTRLIVAGENFEYFFGRPKPTGTVTGLTVFVADVLLYKLTGTEVKFRSIVEGNAATATGLLLENDDIIKGSTGDDRLTGRGGDDVISGRSGIDSLLGQSGKDRLDGRAGADFLDGGGGKDTYVFRDDPSTGIDTIVKLQTGERIELAAKAFAGLTPGALASDQFTTGAEAADADDRIVYDAATGALYHDADGTGEKEQVQFAVLPVDLLDFGAGNFLVI
ncbi:MAG TPA: hypothetical protein VFK86_15965 [Bauldia sp.]|nr:hypothetical protein [Bauldia sp.]